MSEGTWPKIAVMGAGAVGCYFGGMLALAGAPVTLIGRAQHVEAIGRSGLFLDSVHFRGFIPVSASTNVEAARDADLVLLCVKTPETEEAARTLAGCVRRDALVISLQNGVDNVERIRSVTELDALPAVVYVAAAMTAPGSVKHTGRGDLVIGDPGAGGGPARRHQLDEVAALFARAGIPCRVSEAIQTELWTKLVLNCAYNAISALSQARYGPMVRHAETRDVMQKVVEEVQAVGRAAGIPLADIDLLEATWKLAGGMPEATSSTAQDLGRGKRTEIDALNGYVARLGARLGIPTPVNQTLHALVKLRENNLTTEGTEERRGKTGSTG